MERFIVVQDLHYVEPYPNALASYLGVYVDGICSFEAKVRVCLLTILEQVHVVRGAIHELPEIHTCAPPHIPSEGFFVIIGSVI